MLHRVRHSLGLNSGTEKLFGEIEADETFIGGLEGNKHKHKQTKGVQGRSSEMKTPIVGIIERGGELRAKKVKDTKGYSLRPFIVENVAFNSTLNTDEWHGYNGLSRIYKHKKVNHGQGEYVNGSNHTNTMEGFWSLLKRGIDGIYHSVSEKHLQLYVDEFVFRYNTRGISESYRFDAMLNNIAHPLPYKQLIQ